MLEQLKTLALQKLQERMSGNSLNAEATGEAAQEGAGAILESIKGGDFSNITSLFSQGENSEGANNIVSNIQGKLNTILQAKGMSAEEASAESESTANDLVSGLREKFQSTDEADKGFDLSNLTSLLGGNAGNIINQVTGGNASGILNQAKNLFGK